MTCEIHYPKIMDDYKGRLPLKSVAFFNVEQ